ncbi:MAG: creatininase family protein [Pirellulales bacterium]|nr:creatininase family protein [Pirellulales bacterium]
MSAHNPEILLGKLTRREFRQRMQSSQLQAAILPVAAIEQHLEHLAMEHDWRSVNEIAARVARRLAPRVLVAQGVMAGISQHHMRHPGTLSLRPGSFLAVVADLIDSLVRAGFKNILVLNGHGGNIAPCEGIWGQFLQINEINLQFVSYWDTIDHLEARRCMSTPDVPGHAQEFETAIALAAFAENVRTQMWTDQPDQAPSQATAETGERLLELCVAGVERYLREMLDGKRVAEIPPFMP